METVSNTQCRVCGGEGKSSQALYNAHNIQTSDPDKEFVTKMIDCLKCESCGHSWIADKESPQRAIAIEWWNSLSVQAKRQLLSKQPDAKLLATRYLSSLTGREIETLWRKENPIAALPDELINTNFEGIEEEHAFTQVFHNSLILHVRYLTSLSLYDKYEAIYSSLLTLPLTVDELHELTTLLIASRKRNNVTKETPNGK